MSDIFIAHVEEDTEVALEIAVGLEQAGYTTWCYEVDSIPGPSYLIQTGQAVEQAKAVVVVISPHSVGSRQVTKEVVRAYESGKQFVPVLRGITHIEFQNRQPEWREAMGAAVSIGIPLEGVAGILPRIIGGFKALGIQPRSKTDAARIVQIGKALDELRGRGILEKVAEPPVPTRKPEPEAIAAEVQTKETQIRILCQNVMFAAKLNNHTECILALKSLMSMVGDSAMKESIQNLIGAMEYRQKEGIEISDDILNDIDALLRRVQYRET